MKKDSPASIRLVLPYQLHATACYWLAAFLAVAALPVLYLGEVGQDIAFLLFGAGAIMVIVATAIWLCNRSWQRDLRAIAQGRFHVHWAYDDVIWTRFQEQFAVASHKRLLTISAAIGSSGFIAAILMQSDGGLLWDSIFLHYAIFVGASAAFGFTLGLGFWWLDQGTAHLMKRHPGHLFIGDQGLYITGQYWPWETLGQRLVGLTMTKKRTLPASFRIRDHERARDWFEDSFGSGAAG